MIVRNNFSIHVGRIVIFLRTYYEARLRHILIGYFVRSGDSMADIRKLFTLS